MPERHSIGVHVFNRVTTALVLTLPLIVPRVAYCEDGTEESFSWGALVLAGLLLVLLAYLFYLVFR